MRGGPRPGSGRPKGSRNQRTLLQRRAAEAAAQAAAKTGLLPHEILLELARGNNVLGGAPLTRAERRDAAKAAAPYYAPKLIAVAVKATNSENPYEELLRLADGKSRGLPSLPGGTLFRLIKSETKDKDEVKP